MTQHRTTQHRTTQHRTTDVTGAAASAWRLAPGVTRLRDQRLAGGSPFRVARLSPAGAAILQSLLGSEEHPPAGSAAATLAARLVGYGMLLAPPLPATGVGVGDVTVVIPARSAVAPIRALLSGIPPGVPVVLVDDGSPDPLAGRLATREGLVHVRNETSRGPAAARNAGARLAHTRWIAFVDADVVPPPDWLGRLCAHLLTDSVVAVAPRIASVPAGGLGGLVETYSAGLNLGPTAADVGPGSPVSYVPTALLVLDRERFWEIGGFDEDLPVGEDVDLVWRLRATGRIRYQPDIVALHDPHRSSAAIVARRFVYGTGAAALDQRHPGVLRHVDVSVWSFGPWLLGLAVHPVLGLLAAAATVVAAPFTLRALPPADAVALAGRGQVLAGAALGRWLVRPLWPLTGLLVLGLPQRRRVLAAAVGAGVADLVVRAVREDVRTRPEGNSARVLLGSLLGRTIDDLAYSLGIWDSCLRARRFAALYPRVRQLGDLPGAAAISSLRRRWRRSPA